MARRKKRRGPGRPRKYEPEAFIDLAPETKRAVLVVFFFTATALVILALFGLAGSAGAWFDQSMAAALGSVRFLVPLILAGLALIFLLPLGTGVRTASLIGSLIFFFAITGLFEIFRAFNPNLTLTGGATGSALSAPLISNLGQWATLIIFAALTLAGILLATHTSLENLGKLIKILSRILLLPFALLRRLGGRISGPQVLEDGEFAFKMRDLPWKKSKNQPSLPKITSETDEFSKGLKTKIRRKVPVPLDLLNHKGAKPTSGDIKKNMEMIEKTLANFGIPVEMGDVSVGPTVTQYTFKPQEGVKLTRVTALHNDLSLALAAHPIRMEAPIPGKSLVGIEVPNQSVATVGLRELLESPAFRQRKGNLMMALGKDVSGHSWFADLPKMPHMLVAGATGSGKTVSLNSMIVSLLYQNSPEDLKLILIDPKRVELPVYNGIPHLLVPTITDVRKTVNALKWAIAEMERRFCTLEAAHTRDIHSFNKHSKERMPSVVIVVDELADLMAAAPSEVEAGVIRIAQMARAVGIHLVLATQRPSVDVITGLIKANIPARLAFAVASQTDSRTILDTGGADKLLGRGDMLFTSPEISKPRRLQGAFVSDDEIKRVVSFLKDEFDAPAYDVSVTEKQQVPLTIMSEPGSDEDPLLPDAKEVILQAGKASASLLQRRLKIGYARAARLLDLLEAAGFIGPGEGAKPREVLAKTNTEPEEDEEEIPAWE